jgi:4-azaleucine resistance transporter AzlC
VSDGPGRPQQPSAAPPAGEDPVAEESLFGYSRRRLREGFREGVPFGVAALLVGLSFGVLAAPVIGAGAAIVMSAIVFAGSSQFAALAVLGAGGDAAAAIVAGSLLNLRFLAMGVALAPSLRGGWLRRAAEGQTIVDASWALANQGGGRFDRDLLIGATLAQYPCWVLGTIIGALGGSALSDPRAFGLDAIFPAFFLALMWDDLRDRVALSVALTSAVLALALVPATPAGIPVIAAVIPAAIGARVKVRADRR